MLLVVLHFFATLEFELVIVGLAPGDNPTTSEFTTTTPAL
jgi:hypothetical protein